MNENEYIIEIYKLKKENEKLDYLYHTLLDDYVKQFGELQRYKKAFYKACAKLEDFDTLYGDLKQAMEWEKELLEDGK